MHDIIVTLTLAAVLLLGGCGQMGPLYEPGSEQPTATPPSQSAAQTP